MQVITIQKHTFKTTYKMQVITIQKISFIVTSQNMSFANV